MTRTTSVLSVLSQSFLLAACAARAPMQPATPVDVTTVTTSAEPLRAPEPPPVAEPPPARPATPEASASPAASDATGARTTLNDAAILGVVEAARHAQRDQARDAVASAHDPRVTDLARLILSDRIDGKLMRVASTIAGGSTDSPVATELRANQATVTSGLHAAAPTQFDAAYVAAQVSELTSLIHLLDDTLIPQVQDDEVRRVLQDLRASAGRHLAMANGISHP